MKEFYKQLLKQMAALTGVREMEYLSPEDVALRINALVFKSRQFDYIPQDVQQKEIKKQLLAVDPEKFRGLTPAVVEKWLRGIADHWWSKKMGAEIPDVKQHEIRPEVMQEVNAYANSLNEKMNVSGKSRIEKVWETPVKRIEGGYIPKAEEVTIQQLRAKWSAEYHHLDRFPPDNKKDTWISFEQYLKDYEKRNNDPRA